MTNHNRFQALVNALLLLCICFWVQCKKFLIVPDSADQPATAQLFTSDTTATAAVNGIYSEMMQSGSQFCSAQTTVLAGLSADELILHDGGPLTRFSEKRISPADHPLISRAFWRPAYHYIYAANLCLRNLANSAAISPSIKMQLTAECAFIRAFCYFYLVNFFGGVPLITETDFSVNQIKGRTSIEEIYSQIEQDLLQAIDAFNSAPAAANKFRPTRWAALALLARVNCYRGEWTEAINHSSAIISGSGLYLESDPAETFNASSHEAIWQLTPVVPGINWEAYEFIPFGSADLPDFLVSPGLQQSFEPGDLRFNRWIATVNSSAGGTSLAIPNKYRLYQPGATPDQYYVVLRLAEQYLIRAEACIKMNQPTMALHDLNKIRLRAGLDELTNPDPHTLLEACWKERSLEFFAEWGHRWFDLKRSGRADSILGNSKPYWRSTAQWWPIPQDQLDANSALTQNDGY